MPSQADLDRQIKHLMDCKPLPKAEVKTLWASESSSLGGVEYAATVIINPLISLRMLEDFANLSPSNSIVQNGATSIVGQCIIRLTRIRGNIIRDKVGSDEAKEKKSQQSTIWLYTTYYNLIVHNLL